MVWVVGIIAFLVGALIGWWFTNRMCARRLEAAEAEWKRRLSKEQEATATALSAATAADRAAQEARSAAEAATADADAARAEAAAATAAAEQAREGMEAARAEAAAARADADRARTDAAGARAAQVDAQARLEAAAVEVEAARTAHREAMVDAEQARSAIEQTSEPAPPAGEPDDLTMVEGIGPKIAELLADDGIATFSALAAASRDRLAGILERAGSRYRMHDPSTWPEQAALAAARRWSDLADLQDRLSGGRAE